MNERAGARVSAAGVSAALVLVLWFAAPAPLHAAATPVWGDWLGKLRTEGYTVTQGVASRHNCDELVAVFKDCSGNNPAGLSADIEVPVDNAYVDPCYNSGHDCTAPGRNVFTHRVILPNGSPVSVNQFYRLAATQALVVIVRLPPQAAYFGYQNYVWSRARSAYGLPCAAPSPTANNPDPCRALLRADVGNSINHLKILEQSGLALGSGGTVAFVTTANQALYTELAAAFAQVGGAPELLIPEPLGTTITAGRYAGDVIPGLDAEADELNALLRYTLPEDPAAGDAWFNNIAENIQVFRVEKANAPVTPFPAVRIAPKHYTPGESDFQAALDELARDLQAWLQTVTGAPATTAPMRVSPAYSYAGQPVAGAAGVICLDKGTDCKRSTADTDAYRTGKLGKLAHTALLAGVDSTQTGNAAYISVGVYRADIFEGLYSLAQTNPAAVGFAAGTLRGSAADLVAELVARGAIPKPSPALAAALPRLFVAIVTRDCAAGSKWFFCAKDYTVPIDPADIAVDLPVLLTRRAYLHPGDFNGANPRYLVNPVVIK